VFAVVDIVILRTLPFMQLYRLMLVRRALPGGKTPSGVELPGYGRVSSAVSNRFPRQHAELNGTGFTVVGVMPQGSNIRAGQRRGSGGRSIPSSTNSRVAFLNTSWAAFASGVSLKGARQDAERHSAGRSAWMPGRPGRVPFGPSVLRAPNAGS